VLIADDDPDIREALRLLLEDVGYAVAEADDGITTLAFLHATQEECVVLLDLVMPRVDGMEVVRAIAADAVLRSRAHIVVCTARSQAVTDDEARLLDLLGAGMIRKPFDLDDVLSAVGTALGRSL